MIWQILDIPFDIPEVSLNILNNYFIFDLFVNWLKL